MQEENHRVDGGWTPSVYYAESVVNCGIEKAWKVMLDYQAWNPSFVGAEVTSVSGQARAEGEIVMIKKQLIGANGEPLPVFYAETVKVVPHRHIVWYVYKKQGDSFRNFVDFGLSEAPSGVRFNVYYYAQNQISAELLIENRRQSEVSLQNLATAFKRYCEAHAGGNS
jgi:hypothetical protein